MAVQILTPMEIKYRALLDLLIDRPYISWF